MVCNTVTVCPLKIVFNSFQFNLYMSSLVEFRVLYSWSVWSPCLRRLGRHRHLQHLTVPFWALLMENMSPIHLFKEKSGKLNWTEFIEIECFGARLKSFQKNEDCVQERKEAHAKVKGIESEPGDYEWHERYMPGVHRCDRNEGNLTGPSLPVSSEGRAYWQSIKLPRQASQRLDCQTESRSSLHLSAILTLKTTLGYGATHGSPPCCDIVVAHFFGLCQLVPSSSSPNFVAFDALLLLPCGSLFLSLPFVLLLEESYGLGFQTLLESSSHFYNHHQEVVSETIGSATPFMSYSLISRPLGGQHWPWSVPLGCKSGGPWFIRNLQNAALILSVPKASVE